ncbi:MAG: GCN5-related N-acetyltransferase [Pedosphaera sp.]|nr:GCN5-related N-acetyltransferase [Pedosphaera sp.]
MDIRDGYTTSCERALQQDERIHAYLAGSYWAEGIPLALVRRSLDHSLCVGVFWGGDQVAFARVISDRATFAYLCDVYVLEEHRRKGLSAWMLEVITAHPELQGLRRFVLATRDAHGLYAKFGFTPLSTPNAWMEIVKSGLYKQPTDPALEPATTTGTIHPAGGAAAVGPS